MFKFFVILLLLVILVAGGIWFSAQSLPGWYEEDEPAVSASERLSQQVQQQGVGGFLGSKLSQILGGKLVLNETEFNALLMASLRADKDGQKLLAVSDAVNATIHPTGIEIGAVINLNKVEKIDARARETVEKVNQIFPFLNKSRVAVALIGMPVARNGELGVKDDFSVKVGAIPISNDSLRQLGANVERANYESLDLKYLRVKSVSLRDGEIELSVTPRL
ncbi:MAG: hypothetical protein AAF197_04495 [Pseudomonadota bacterium]